MNKNNNIIIKMVSLSCIVLYLVIRVTDIIRTITSPSDLIRYIPICIATVLTTHLYIVSCAKKCTKSEENNMISQLRTASLIIAAIVVIYGIISVNSNVEEFRNKYSKSGYSALNINNEVENIIKNAEKQATMHWIITAAVYLASAQLVIKLSKNKISMLTVNDNTSTKEEKEKINLQNIADQYSRFQDEAEQTPAEQTPMEQTPMEQTPIEQTPMEQTPMEQTPMEQTPMEQTPMEQTPMEQTPVEQTPMEQTPVEQTPVEQHQVELNEENQDSLNNKIKWDL